MMDHRGDEVGGDFPRRTANQVDGRAEGAHRAEFLDGEDVRSGHLEAVALYRTHKRERGSCASTTCFDHRHPRLQVTAAFSLFDHGFGHPVLVGAGWIEYSSLTKTCACPSGTTRHRRTTGVLPTAS